MIASQQEQARRKYGALSDPTIGDQIFEQRDQNHDGYLAFDEFTEGECKNGHLLPWPPPLPKD